MSLFFNKFNFDIWYCSIVLIAILQGIDIGTTFYGINNNLGGEANLIMAAIINTPELLILFKSIPVIGVFLYLYYMKPFEKINHKNYIYAGFICLLISMCLIAPISNTYAIITGINIFPTQLLPHNIIMEASRLVAN